VEVDANPNPLRDLLACPSPRVADGFVILGDAPGLGAAPDLDAVRDFRVPHAYR
jgi:L-alanine-DL-glutamate epimerase-like enolase superfamily enzyme